MSPPVGSTTEGTAGPTPALAAGVEASGADGQSLPAPSTPSTPGTSGHYGGSPRPISPPSAMTEEAGAPAQASLSAEGNIEAATPADASVALSPAGALAAALDAAEMQVSVPRPGTLVKPAIRVPETSVSHAEPVASPVDFPVPDAAIEAAPALTDILATPDVVPFASLTPELTQLLTSAPLMEGSAVPQKVMDAVELATAENRTWDFIPALVPGADGKLEWDMVPAMLSDAQATRESEIVARLLRIGGIAQQAGADSEYVLSGLTTVRHAHALPRLGQPPD
jgi:hypothetical protein